VGFWTCGVTPPCGQRVRRSILILATAKRPSRIVRASVEREGRVNRSNPSGGGITPSGGSFGPGNRFPGRIDDAALGDVIVADAEVLGHAWHAERAAIRDAYRIQVPDEVDGLPDPYDLGRSCLEPPCPFTPR
jgi:hypothetical protein